MKLPAAGVEYYTFTATADFDLTGTVAVYISTSESYPAVGVAWVPVDWSAPGVIEADGDRSRPFQVLLAGSAVPTAGVPAGALQLDAGMNYAFVKLTDNPEVIIRKAGKIEAL